MVSVGKVRSELERIVVSGRVVMIRRRLVAVPIWDNQRNKKRFFPYYLCPRPSAFMIGIEFRPVEPQTNGALHLSDSAQEAANCVVDRPNFLQHSSHGRPSGPPVF